MRIAVLMGSPRKRDSYKICKEIENLMQEQGNQFEYIFLSDYEVKDCRGCDQCFQKTERLCPCKDDLEVIKNKLINADGIIFATPVYAYQVPAPLKRLIDRMSYWFHRQELVGKPAGLVITTGGGGHKEVGKYMKMTISGWGCHLVGEVSIVSPFYFKGQSESAAFGYKEKYHIQAQKKVTSLAKQLQEAVLSQSLYVPTYYDLFMYNCLRTKTVTSKADYEFWLEKGWMQAPYFYDVKLSPFKRLFGNTLKLLIDSMVKRMLPKINMDRCE